MQNIPTATVVESGTYTINLQLHGTWFTTDGTTDAVDFTVNGYINDTPDDLDELNIRIELPNNFRYSVNTPDPSFVSMNQKYSDLPHLMICPTYVYDKQTNSSVWSYLAFDLEKEYIAVMFESQPDCYLVASADSSVAHTELLKHFADFMESYGFDH